MNNNLVLRTNDYDVYRPMGNVLEIVRRKDGKIEQLVGGFAEKLIDDFGLDDEGFRSSPYIQLWGDEILGCYFDD